MVTWSTPPTWTSGQTSGVSTGLQKLSDDLTIVGQAWTAYTPTWSAATTAPVLNNGTLVGRFNRPGQTVDFAIQITMGSSTTYGSGNWAVTLPVTPHGENVTFIGQAYDSSATAWYPVIGTTAGGSTVTLRALPTTAGTFAPGVTATVPFTWASGDILSISGRFEAA